MFILAMARTEGREKTIGAARQEFIVLLLLAEEGMCLHTEKV